MRALTFPALSGAESPPCFAALSVCEGGGQAGAMRRLSRTLRGGAAVAKDMSPESAVGFARAGERSPRRYQP
ncbi:Uncharacterised protein [Mycobacteroides abscessus subsp. abscessus]|nr:Uncharacterised protein [Mycobacteroides abscessus subsp. abscessus]